MTHQPPIPEAAISPYPLHTAPIPEEQRLASAEAEERAGAEAASDKSGGLFTTMLALGAAIGIGAAAAGLFYLQSRSKAVGPPAAGNSGGDDKGKRGKADRDRVAAGEPYEITYFARKHGIKAAEDRAIIKEAGPDRAAANALAARNKN